MQGRHAFSWALLQEETAASLDAAVPAPTLQVAKALVGPAWGKFYGDSDPGITDVVPQQVALALQRQLGSLKAQLQAGQDVVAQADTNFEAIKQASKRARLGLQTEATIAVTQPATDEELRREYPLAAPARERPAAAGPLGR